MRNRTARNRESGFALLFIYAMAATVAIMLLMELPRVAFEAQRDKEQLLIDRGEQYTRAVTLYVRKFNKFPADFDALQSTQNLRFLRHKYIDPMTGKDDWRIVHVGPGGVFTDSLIYGKKKDAKQTADQQNFITELQQTGGNQVTANQNVNVGTRQRQSDQPGAPGFVDPNNPNQPLQQNGLPPLPQFDANGQLIPPAPPANGSVAPGGFPGTQPGVPGQPPIPNGLPPGVQMPTGQPFPNQSVAGFPTQQPSQQPFQQPGQPAVPTTAAGNLINQILTTPRPGGLNGMGGFQQSPVDQNGNPLPNTSTGATTATTATNTGATPGTAPAQTIGGGMAGVASKLEEDGIKVYKDQTSYNKWEFVYDITKDPSRTAQMPASAQNPGAANGAANGTAGATPAASVNPNGAAGTTPVTATTPVTPAPVPSTPAQQ